MSQQPMPGEGQEVRLQLAATVEMALVARLVASGIATRLGLGAEQADDLRIAADECFVAVANAARQDAYAELTFRWNETWIAFDASAPAAPTAPAGLDLLVREILGAVTDRYHYAADAATVRAGFERRGP